MGKRVSEQQASKEFVDEDEEQQQAASHRPGSLHEQLHALQLRKVGGLNLASSVCGRVQIGFCERLAGFLSARLQRLQNTTWLAWLRLRDRKSVV